MREYNEGAAEEAALAFARTLQGKSTAEAIGQLMLAFVDMDLVSAKALIWIVALEAKSK
jgi:hypothetical protein